MFICDIWDPWNGDERVKDVTWRCCKDGGPLWQRAMLLDQHGISIERYDIDVKWRI